MNRRRVSVLWNYFKVESEQNKIAICSLCKVKLSFRATVSNLRKHLRTRHRGILIPNALATNLKRQQSTVYVGDPLLVSGHDSPKSVKSDKDNVAARRSSLRGPRKTNLRKPLETRHQEEDEALDTTEFIPAEPKIRRVYQPRFALSWDSYQNRLCSNLNSLLKNEDFVDLTLAADGHLVRVHQLIMGIASPYLKEIIHSSPTRHPIIFLTNVSYPTLRHLLQYVYTGQVDITEDELEPFFTAAKALQIQGIDTEIDTNILKSKAVDQIGDPAKLPPDTNETAVDKDGPACDYFDESQILIIPRSAKTTTSVSDTERILSKRHPTHCTSQTLAEELDPGDLEDVMMDEEMVIAASEDSSGGVDPIEFYEVSRSDDPDPVRSPPPKNPASFMVQTMLLNHYKYALVRTFEGGVRKWRCLDHLKRGCPARIITSGSTVVERSQSHNHPFRDQK